jgi:hypothetical protein
MEERLRIEAAGLPFSLNMLLDSVRSNRALEADSDYEFVFDGIRHPAVLRERTRAPKPTQ